MPGTDFKPPQNNLFVKKMKNNLLVLILTAIILAAVAWFALTPKNQGKTDTLLPGLKPEKVERIVIESGNQTTTLFAKDGAWFVAERADYPADNPKILRLLREMWELRPTQAFSVTQEDLAQLGLATKEKPKAADDQSHSENPEEAESIEPIRVSFRDANNQPIAGLTLGKLHTPTSGPNDFPSPPIGRYVQSADSTSKAALVRDTFFEVSANPANWLDRQFFQTGNLTSIEWKPSEGNRGWLLQKEGESWKLADLQPEEKLDESKVSLATSSLSSPIFNDVVVENSEEQPEGLLTLKNDQNLVFTLTVGKEANAARQVKVEITAEGDEYADQLAKQKRFSGQTYLIPSYLLQNVVVTREALLAAPEEKASEQPAEGAAPAEPSSATTEPVMAPSN